MLVTCVDQMHRLIWVYARLLDMTKKGGGRKGERRVMLNLNAMISAYVSLPSSSI